MNIKMIRIERSAKMEAAVERCKLNHPKIRRVDAQTVTVYGSKGDAYTVRFAEPKPGLKLAACDCPAGQESKVCYHIPAALAAPIITMGARDEKAELVADISAVWKCEGYTGFAITQGLLRRFGVNRLEMIHVDYLRRMRAAQLQRLHA